MPEEPGLPEGAAAPRATADDQPPPVSSGSSPVGPYPPLPEEPLPEPTPAAPPRRKASFLAELPVLILIAFVLAILMKTFLVQAFFIPSSSMEPTLLINDRVLVNKLSYTFREPRRGEVVVFSERGFDPLGQDDTGIVEGLIESLRSGLGLVPPTEKDFIKRIIGLPGETIEMIEGVVYVDGTPLEEAPTTEGGYLSTADLTDFGPVTVPQGELFMMGDNRPSSADSRSTLGTIAREDVIGRAFVIIWPVDRLGGLPIAEYQGVPVEMDDPGAAEDAASAREPALAAS